MPRLRTRIVDRFLGFVEFLRRENLFRLMAVIVTLVVLGAFGLVVFEKDQNFLDALWWAIVTLTTVGFGDISPATVGGRIIGVILMFFGIGVLGLFTATIAGVFVEQRMRKERGMGSYDCENHVILCEWNELTREILKDLRADPRSSRSPMVLIADVDVKPVEDEDLFFVRGNVTEENLKRANIEKAKTVVIVGDRRLDYSARDARAVLSTLTVESLNPEVYSIVELAHEENVRHCQRAHADEIIVGPEFSSRLISTAALDHGVTKVISELLNAQFGQDLIIVSVPQTLIGRPFLEVFSELKRARGMIALALQRGVEVVTNPEADVTVTAGDRLVVISPRLERGGEVEPRR